MIKSALTTAAMAATATLGMGMTPAGATQATTPAAAPQAQQAAAAAQCGWYTDWTATAWYNHCGPGRVVIYVDLLSVGGSSEGYEKCVGPGDTWLGSWPGTQGAWYVGRTC